MVSLGELISSPIFIGTYMVAIIFLLLFALSARWSIFGLGYFMKKISGQFGLLFFRTTDGNIKLPKFVNLNNTEAKIKYRGVTKIFPYDRNEFNLGRFFGMPFTIKDTDDASRT